MPTLKYYDPQTGTYRPLSVLFGDGGSGGEDKTYQTSFADQSEVTVYHYLNKFPAVSVVDTANNEVNGEVEYVNLDSVVLRFSAPFSGKVFCN